ncbi:MAG: glycosyltransferase family 2 protein [Nonlabens sp.]|nr:glycosyltransferase family 2 protein [Nonlabens sp.]MDP5101032.1 glycosyltransferase family 2 protein [Nonlabens sp.]
MPFKTSLVASTYNWPEALELLLLSVKIQTVLPDEVVIADDGSSRATTDLIESFQKDFPVPLIHVWQDDNGNRKTSIMNKAIAKATGDYIIEIDGDIIMHPAFVSDHLSLLENKTFLYGSRVNIQESKLKTLFKGKQIRFHYFSKGIKKRNRTLRIPLLANRAQKEIKRSRKLRGCNVSFWKADFIAINGYNEEMTGWGMEDSEMIQRLVNNGISGKRLKHKGIAYHIYHFEQDKSSVPANQQIELLTEERKIIKSPKGIDQYL